MTLVIAAHGHDYIVLGTDSRGTIQDTAGTRVEINIMRKLIPVTKHVAILLYGDCEAANSLVENFKSTLRRNLDGVSDVSKRFADFCREEIKKIKDVPLQRFPFFGFIIAGLDRRGLVYMVPRCYTLNSHTGFMRGLCEHFAIQGKPFIALYLFNRRFQENMMVNDLSKLVAQAIDDTKAVDGDVGGKIRIAIIDSNGLRELGEADVDILTEK